MYNEYKISVKQAGGEIFAYSTVPCRKYIIKYTQTIPLRHKIFSIKLFFYNKKDFLERTTTLLHQMITLYPAVTHGITIAICLLSC